MQPLSDPTDLQTHLLLAKVIVMAFAAHAWLLSWRKLSNAYADLFGPKIDSLNRSKQMEAPPPMLDSIRPIFIWGVLVISGFVGFGGMIVDVLITLGIRP